MDDDGDSLQIDIEPLPPREEKKDPPVTWRSLPNKRQLAILVIARLSEPLVQSSLRVSLLSIFTMLELLLIWTSRISSTSSSPSIGRFQTQ